MAQMKRIMKSELNIGLQFSDILRKCVKLIKKSKKLEVMQLYKRIYNASEADIHRGKRTQLVLLTAQLAVSVLLMSSTW